MYRVLHGVRLSFHTSCRKEYDRKDVSMNVEYMNILTIETPEILNQYKENLFSTYGNNPPKAVLMLGNAPLILRDDMRRHWGDIPLIVCAESRYIGPDSTYMYNQIIPYKDRIYLKDLRNEYNMTFLAARAFIPEKCPVAASYDSESEEFTVNR